MDEEGSVVKTRAEISREKRSSMAWRKPSNTEEESLERGTVEHADVARKLQAKDNPIDDERRVYANVLKHKFARVICDEGHRLKNTLTRNHRAVYTVYARYKWIITATPMINAVSDYLGYLNFFWHPSWSVEEYDEYPDKYGDIYTTEYADQFLAKFPEYGEKFTCDQQATSTPFWVIDPRPFSRLVNRNQMTGTVAFNALRSILSLLQLRYTMASRLEVNEQTVRIGDSIPMYRITTVEIDLQAWEERQYKKIWDSYVPYLVRKASKTGGGER
jgi:SNF2-related domain